MSEKKHHGVHWVHLWSAHSKDLAISHKVQWRSMSDISLVLEKRVKLEDADP